MTLVCGALLLLSAATSALAAPDQVLVEQASSPARADGDDTIAYFAQPGTMQLLDAGGTPTAVVDVGSGCLDPPAQLDAVGGGQALFSCAVQHDFSFGPSPSSEPRLLDLSTRTVHVPAGAVEAWYDALSEPLGFARFEDVGAYGIRLWSTSYHSGASVTGIDWHTGARTGSGAEPTQLLDVDAPGLLATLCAPLRQRRWDVPFTGVTDPPPIFDPLLYEAPYAVTWGPRSPLTLKRCGSASSQTLQAQSKRGEMLRVVQLAGGIVSWLAGDYTRSVQGTAPLRGYLPACGVRIERPVSIVWRDLLSPQIAHVRDALVLSEQFERDGAWRISRLPLDGVCDQTQKAWSLTAAVAGRTATLQARVGATQRLVNRNWLATRLAPSAVRSAPLRARAGSVLWLYPKLAAHAIRWRIDAGPWHRLSVVGGWRLPLPPTAGPHVLSLRVRSRQGGDAQYGLRLALRR